MTTPSLFPAASREVARAESPDPFLLSDTQALKAEAEVGVFLARSWVLIDQAASIHAASPAVLRVRAGRIHGEEGGLE